MQMHNNGQSVYVNMSRRHMSSKRLSQQMTINLQCTNRLKRFIRLQIRRWLIANEYVSQAAIDTFERGKYDVALKMIDSQ